MGKSDRGGGIGGVIAAVLVVLVAVGVGVYFWFQWQQREALDHPSIAPTSQTTMATKVKNDPAIHKKVNRYLSQFGFVGSFEVSKPTSKSIYMTVHTANKDERKTTQILANAVASLYLYLGEVKADRKTMVTITITDGDLRGYDLRSMGWKEQVSYGELKDLIVAYQKAFPNG